MTTCLGKSNFLRFKVRHRSNMSRLEKICLKKVLFCIEKYVINMTTVLFCIEKYVINMTTCTFYYVNSLYYSWLSRAIAKRSEQHETSCISKI